MVPVVFLESFHSFLLSSTFCISSSFFCHTFCSNWNLEPFLLSRAGRSQLPFGMIISVHPGRYLLRVILQGEQRYSEVHYVYMDGCQSHERGCNHCEIAHADFTLVKFHCLLDQGILLIGKNIPDVLPQVYKQENPWLLTLAQGDMSHKQVFLGFQCS